MTALNDEVPKDQLCLTAIGGLEPLHDLGEVFPDFGVGSCPVNGVEGIDEVSLNNTTVIGVNVGILDDGIDGVNQSFTPSSNSYTQLKWGKQKRCLPT